MKNVTLDHLNLTTGNLDQTLAWYQDVFGFETVESGTRNGRRWAIVKSGQHMLCFSQYPDRSHPDLAPESVHRIYHFGLRIQDRTAWEGLLAARNDIAVHHGPIRYPHSTSWYVSDPSGHEIEVALWDGDQATF